MEPREFLECRRKYFIGLSHGIFHRCLCQGWAIQRKSRFVKRHHLESLESFLSISDSSWAPRRVYDADFLWVAKHGDKIVGVDGYHGAFDACSPEVKRPRVSPEDEYGTV